MAERDSMAEHAHFDPDTYDEVVSAEVPAYQRLQDAVVQATLGRTARRVLDLGSGTGVTAQRIASHHPGVHLVGLDEDEAMLERARGALPDADFRVGRLEDALPTGPFDTVVSALAVHHLDSRHKADLFVRVARLLSPGGRFVLGDLIVPDDPGDVVTPISDEHDQPGTLHEQLAWLADAGFVAHAAWVERDLAVMVGDLP